MNPFSGEKKSSLKRKNLLPLEDNSFLLEYTTFQKNNLLPVESFTMSPPLPTHIQSLLRAAFVKRSFFKMNVFKSHILGWFVVQ